MKTTVARWYILLEIGDVCIGLGWWPHSYKLFAWDSGWCDGRLWALRLGPLFVSRGPY